MRSISGRLRKLEDRLGITRNAPRYLLIVMDAGKELGPAEDAYIKSLDEAGLLPSSGFGLVDLLHIPERHTEPGAALEISVELL
jgi:hypothetical protein